MICRQIQPAAFERSPIAPGPTNPAPTEETPMREFVRPIAAALSIACLAAAMAIVSTGAAWAQAKQAPPAQAAPPQQPAVKQLALTDKQIECVPAEQKHMPANTGTVPQRP